MKGNSYGQTWPKALVVDNVRAIALLYDTYHPDKPLNKHLGLSSGGKRIKDCDALVQEIIPRHLCMFALDPKGKPIGVAINNACHKSELDVSMQQVNFIQELEMSFFKTYSC